MNRLAREEQKLRSERMRQAILDVAMEMGLREGFDAVSIRKIIGRMNYSTGVVYYHFKDRQEIIDAIVDAETRRFNRMVVAMQDEKKDVLSNMEAIFHRVMLLAREEPEKYNLIVLRKYSGRAQDMPEWIAPLAAKLKRAMDEGDIRRADPGRAAFAVWSSFLGFHLTLSRQENLTPEEAEALFKVEFDILARGLGRRDREGKGVPA